MGRTACFHVFMLTFCFYVVLQTSTTAAAQVITGDDKADADDFDDFAAADNTTSEAIDTITGVPVVDLNVENTKNATQVQHEQLTSTPIFVTAQTSCVSQVPEDPFGDLITSEPSTDVFLDAAPIVGHLQNLVVTNILLC